MLIHVDEAMKNEERPQKTLIILDHFLFVETLFVDDDASRLIYRLFQVSLLAPFFQYRRRLHRVSPRVVAEPANHSILTEAVITITIRLRYDYDKTTTKN